MLEVCDLHVALRGKSGDVEIVRGIDFELRPGETYALVGESGCGKSMSALSVMRLLPEALRVTRGSIRLDGVELLDLTEDAMCAYRGARLAMVFQEPATCLNPVLRIGDQLMEVMRLHGKKDARENRRQAVDWLCRVGIDHAEARMDAYPFELSGGQKQRVMIAMALAAGPSVVLADEPTTALDVTLQAQILDLLKDLQREAGIALLLISHDLALVRRYADRIGLMYAGEIVEEADAKTFFQEPRHPYAKGLLRAIPQEGCRHEVIPIVGTVPAMRDLEAGCAFAPRCALAKDDCRSATIALDGVATHRVRCLHAEGESDAKPPASMQSQPLGEPVLTVSDLCVGYRERGFSWRSTVQDVVRHASLTLRRGETLALVGESGSGKTTLAKAILRLLDDNAVVSGRVVMGGSDVLAAKGKELRRLRSVAQIVFQDPFASLNPRMRVGEVLEEGMKALLPSMSVQERQARVEDLLSRVGLLRESAKRYPHEFSGGQRQRIAIARALAVEPQIVICDEPTSALDVSVQAQILNLLRELQRERGLAFLLITHNFGVVEYLADTVAVMQSGVIVEYGTMQEVLHHPRNAYTQSLIAAVPRL